MDNKIWKNIRHIKGVSEATPFEFKGKKYTLFNLTAMANLLPEGEADRAVIMEAGTDKKICEVLPEHYFISAYVVGDKCYCIGSYMGPASKKWHAHQIHVVYSDDLIHWSEPQLVIDYPDGYVYNSTTVFDGERYIMLFETDDHRYPIFTFRFLESRDLLHWKLLDRERYGEEKYVGGPALYYFPEEKYFYLTYVNEFINEETRQPNYDTCIARSKNLIDWEEGDKPIIFPDYEHRPQPEEYPDVYEINASDAEFIEHDGKVTVFYCGGNQQGVMDAATAEYDGTLLQLFNEYFGKLKRNPTAEEFYVLNNL